jgi:hypothetical protein
MGGYTAEVAKLPIRMQNTGYTKMFFVGYKLVSGAQIDTMKTGFT